MNLGRLLISICFLMATASVFATEADDIKKELKHAKGKERLEYLARLCDKSMDGDDYALQLKCINDYLEEAHRQGNHKEESDALWMWMILFYNNDQSDSVYKYIDNDLQFIREYGSQEKYYDAWSCLVNTYVYSGSLSAGLKEAEKMYDQARENKNDFGSGLACYVMGKFSDEHLLEILRLHLLRAPSRPSNSWPLRWRSIATAPILMRPDHALCESNQK